MAEKPSFVLFITDQQQANMLGCAGDPVVQTPNIDAMAASGIRFDRFYVAMPSCMPNRASMMTGLYPSVNGVRFNGIPLPAGSVTFPELLRRNGYRTGLMGKGHLQPILKPYRESAVSGGWWRREVDNRGADLAPPYYGYDRISIVTGHGDHCGGHYEQWLRGAFPEYRDHIGARNQLAHNYCCPQAVRTRLPEEFYPTTYIADRAIEFLEEHARCDSDSPFLLVVSFPDPHHPFNPPGRYWSMYNPDEVALQANFAAPDTGVPHLAAARAARTGNSDDRDGYGAVALNEREAREAIALTYGMITMIDDAVGRIRARLAELGLADDTVQVFTSDHGDLLGDHGLMLKGPLHYQSLVRVPFILSDPKARSDRHVETGLFSSIDIAPSLLSRAGVADVPSMHGMPVYDVIEGRCEPRRSLLVEDEYQLPVLSFDTPPTVRTILTDRWRMTVFDNADWGELYDLKKDPSEVTNLWHDNGTCNTRAKLLRELASCMMRSIDRRASAVSLA